jgi:hypothetical protein
MSVLWVVLLLHISLPSSLRQRQCRCRIRTRTCVHLVERGKSLGSARRSSCWTVSLTNAVTRRLGCRWDAIQITTHVNQRTHNQQELSLFLARHTHTAVFERSFPLVILLCNIPWDRFYIPPTSGKEAHASSTEVYFQVGDQ